MNFVPDITLTSALNDSKSFGPTFSSLSFWTWKVMAKLIDGIPLTEQREIELFEQCTGRKYNRQARRALLRLTVLAGRRAGKDRFFSAVGLWRCICCDWSQHISAGEGAVVILLGKSKLHAAILRKYCFGLLQAPLLKAQVTRQTNEVIEFRNGSSLEIVTNDAGLIRGRSAIAVLGSECCFWKIDEHSSSSDEEVVGAAVPSMSMAVDGGLLALWSSVHKKRGYMYRKFRQLYGNEEASDDEICWYAPSRTMNPRLPPRIVEQALAEDRYKAGAEYEGRWREDLSDFVPIDVIERCTTFGIIERAPSPDHSYFAFTDPAGGTGSDLFTLAIAHREQDGTVKIDAIRERKPRFIPRDVIAEYAILLKSYGISEVSGDGFAGGFCAYEWEDNSITFKPAEYTTSENYLHVLPMLLSGRAHLADSVVLRNQLGNLERRIQPSGHEIVSHPQVASAHDDVAAAVAGALVLAGNRLSYNTNYAQWVGGDWQALRTALYLQSGGTFRLW